MPDPAGFGAEFETSVFVNCPFDDAYKPMFEAIVFAVFDCGYRPRCALEAYDAGKSGSRRLWRSSGTAAWACMTSRERS